MYYIFTIRLDNVSFIGVVVLDKEEEISGAATDSSSRLEGFDREEEGRGRGSVDTSRAVIIFSSFNFFFLLL